MALAPWPRNCGGEGEKERERTQFRPNPDQVQPLDLVQEEGSIDDIEKQ